MTIVLQKKKKKKKERKQIRTSEVDTSESEIEKSDLAQKEDQNVGTSLILFLSSPLGRLIDD